MKEEKILKIARSDAERGLDAEAITLGATTQMVLDLAKLALNVRLRTRAGVGREQQNS
ncbi:MAG TPA: hypothetical protein VGO68_05285 [Pyrinomonadaceae bacterium]|nr:hypothetical protein [Pyrinomonadaceae bacterium]